MVSGSPVPCRDESAGGREVCVLKLKLQLYDALCVPVHAHQVGFWARGLGKTVPSKRVSHQCMHAQLLRHYPLSVSHRFEGFLRSVVVTWVSIGILSQLPRASAKCTGGCDFYGDVQTGTSQLG
jgi:hypothetical protein